MSLPTRQDDAPGSPASDSGPARPRSAATPGAPDEPEDRPEDIVPELSRLRRPRYRPTPLVLFVIFIPLMLALVLWVRYLVERPRIQDYTEVRLPWIELEMPGEVVEERVNPYNGVHFVSGVDARREMVVALLPMPEGSHIRSTFAEGPDGPARVFRRVFHRAFLRDVGARHLPYVDTYVLNGRREEDDWQLAGRIRLFEDRGWALAVMALAPDEDAARRAALHIFQTAVVRLGGEYVEVSRPVGPAPPEDLEGQ